MAAFAYTGLMTVTTFQAVRGHSAIRFDAPTLALAAGFVVLSVAALVLVVRKARLTAPIAPPARHSTLVS